MAGTGRSGGFTLIESTVVCALLVCLTLLTLPNLGRQDHRAGRLDAVEALTRVQQAQEMHRSTQGLYASELWVLRGTSATSAQGRYTISIEREGAESYTARAQALGRQADDTDCSVMTLQVRQGFAQIGPSPRCWHR